MRYLLSFLVLLGASRAFASDLQSLQQAAQHLGWHTDNSYCQGYFLATSRTPLPKAHAQATEIDADEIIAPLQGDWQFKGPVRLRTQDYTLWADSAIVKPLPHSDKHQWVQVTKNFRLQQKNTLLLADHGHFNLANDNGELFDSWYRLELDSPPVIDQELKPRRLEQSAWGHAARIKQTDREHFTSFVSTYSTCAPLHRAWNLKAQRLEIDRKKNLGVAHHAWLYFYHVPIFYTPYLSFPLNKERKTGLLAPKLSVSSQNGFTYTQPFYMNLAPNYDTLLNTSWIAKRGLYVDTLSRYITNNSHGQLRFGALPKDSAFLDFQQQAKTQYANNPFLNNLMQADSQRLFVHWDHSTMLTESLQLKFDYNWASDNYFVNDIMGAGQLSNTNAVVSQLVQELQVNYDKESLSFNAGLKRYQTLQQVTQSAFTRPYDEMPRLNFNYHPYISRHIAAKLAIQFTNFSLSPEFPSSPVTGERLYFVPEIAFPWQNSYAFFKPKIKWHISYYQFGHSQLGSSTTSITRSLPITHIDSGLIFDRQFKLKQHRYRQTLEPRLFYLYIPYRDQNGIPVFDTSLLNYNYPQLFNDNRFAGYDRIGDTRQITLGMTSRIQRDNGQELGHLSVGQIFYNGQPRVNICDSLGCTNDPSVPLEEAHGITRSIWAMELNLQPTRHWSGTFNNSYNPKTHHWINRTATISYMASKQRIINVNYTQTQKTENWLYLRAQDKKPTRLAGLSAVWALSPHWALTGALQHDLERHFIQDYLFGIEYNGCCWALRVVGGRSMTEIQGNKPVYNKGVFLQWRFNGLGSFSNADPGAVLRQRIAHYDGQWMR